MPKPLVPHSGETVEQCRERVARRRRLNAVALLVGIVALIIVLSYTAFFPMTKFHVSGGTRYAQSVLEEAAAVAHRTQLLNLSSEKVRDNLLAELPYLEQVSVRRRLPNTLAVEVWDAKIILAIELKDGYVVISGKGKVLELTDKKPEDAIPFALNRPYDIQIGQMIIFDSDEEKNSWIWQIFEAFIAAYENCSYTTEITALDMKNPYSPSMSYQNRITLRLGSRDSFAAQLRFAKRTIELLNTEDSEKKRKPSKGVLKLDVDGQSFFTAE